MVIEAYRLAWRPVSATVGVGRWVVDMGLDFAGDAALSVLDAVLASPRADEAADRILASRLAEHAVSRALSGDLVDVFAREAVRYAVLERISDRLLEAGLAEQLAQRFLVGPELERMVALVLQSERVEAALANALDSADLERLITRVVESRLIEATVTRLVDETAARLPESPALWALIDEVAQSPAVTDAITRQSLGLADEVAGEVRDRSRSADAWLERAARRVLRRQASAEPFTP